MGQEAGQSEVTGSYGRAFGACRQAHAFTFGHRGPKVSCPASGLRIRGHSSEGSPAAGAWKASGLTAPSKVNARTRPGWRCASTRPSTEP